MSDRADAYLDLITQPGVIEVVMALNDHDGSASLADLKAAGVAHPAAPLRALAAAGQVLRSDHGTWDTEPRPDTLVALTDTGLGLANSLLKAEEWGRRNLPSPDGTHWLERLRRRR